MALWTSTRFFSMRQMETLREYVTKNNLLFHGLGDQTSLIRLLPEFLNNLNPDEIVPRLDNFASLLEIHRALLTGTTRLDRSGHDSSSSTGQTTSTSAAAATTTGDTATAVTTKPRKATPEKAASLPDKPSEDYAFLWNTAEKLYNSWQVKLLGVLLISAVLLAGTGTVLIGDKALELRKSLEDASNKETANFEFFAKTTRETVTTQSQTVLANLDRQQTEIDRKMTQANDRLRELESRTTEIRDAAVSRVSQEIRDHFAPVEKQLKEEIEGLLKKMKEGDVHDLQITVTQLGTQLQTFATDLSAKQAALTAAEPKIKTLVEATANADNLKTQADLIPGMKISAEEALKKITETQQAALNADAGAQGLANEVASRLKPQMDKILEYQTKLGGTERDLSALAAAIDKIGLNTAGTQQLLNSAERANNSLSLISNRLAELNKTVDALEERVKHLPPSAPPPVRPLTEKDLGHDEWLTIQKTLHARKFFFDDLDGKVGTLTRGAIRKYQKSIKATEDGILTSDQISDLLGAPTR